MASARRGTPAGCERANGLRRRLLDVLTDLPA
jgi:hypothetical protein